MVPLVLARQRCSIPSARQPRGYIGLRERKQNHRGRYHVPAVRCEGRAGIRPRTRLSPSVGGGISGTDHCHFEHDGADGGGLEACHRYSTALSLCVWGDAEDV